MVAEPFDNGMNLSSDPFLLIQRILISRVNYLHQVIDATCKTVSAFRVSGPLLPWHTYLLVAEADGDKITAGYFDYLVRHPGPNTFTSFETAECTARELAAKADIPFSEFDQILNQCRRCLDRNQQLLLVPWIARANLGGKLHGPMQLNRIWLDEYLSYQPLFDRLKAFSIQVRSKLDVNRIQMAQESGEQGRSPKATAIDGASSTVRISEQSSGSQPTSPQLRRKRSTLRGEAEAKLIATLTEHHQYADGSCLNQESVGNNEFAEAADVSTSTASKFFKENFGGYAKYRAVCRDSGRLADYLKQLNGEFSPHELFGRRPPNEDDRDDRREKDE
jgi:hypothetical protein